MSVNLLKLRSGVNLNMFLRYLKLRLDFGFKPVSGFM